MKFGWLKTEVGLFNTRAYFLAHPVAYRAYIVSAFNNFVGGQMILNTFLCPFYFSTVVKRALGLLHYFS